MKAIAKLAWRNIWRNWRRTFLSSFAIALGVFSIVFLQSYIYGIVGMFFENLIRNEIGHVKIAAKEFLRLEKSLPKEHLIFNSQDLKETISPLPGVKSMTKRIKFHLMLSHGDKNEPCLGFGIDPEQETNFLNIKKYITQGSYIEDSKSEMIIGYKLAKKLSVAVGDELLAVTTDINFSTYALTFIVSGIFETGFPVLDKNYFYIPLEKAQELLDCEGASHEIILLADDSAQAPEITANIQAILKDKGLEETLTAIPWQDHYMMSFMPWFNYFIGVLMFIIMMIAGLVILNTMLMAVLERTHEIGIIKSMGMRDRGIVSLILTESLYIGTIGAAIGGAIGSSLSILTEKTGIDYSWALEKVEFPIPFMTSVFYPKFALTYLITSIIFAIGMTLIATLYPAIKASRMAPVEALRTTLK